MKYTSGIPSKNSSTVVTDASLKLNQKGDQFMRFTVVRNQNPERPFAQLVK